MSESRSASTQGRVLVLDTNAQRAQELCNRLRLLNYEPVTAQSGQDFAAMTDAPGIAVILGDLSSEQGVCRAFRALSTKRPTMPVLRISGTVMNAAVDEMLNHHHTWELDFPVRRSQLAQLLRRAERFRGRERRVRLTGKSNSIRGVRKLIEQVSDFDTSVLITGESGTGKELVARAIHDLSERSDKPFVPINCGAIPSELLESELFGHEKGAFTGAINVRLGRFEHAEGGTLLLDEIGDMSTPMQAKLLRVLQERSYERVGSNKTRHCNVRIIAATHRNLPDAVSKGEFREDLYYRLNVFPIEIPPLRIRTSDLPALLDALQVQHQDEGNDRVRFTEEAMHALANYAWPGNIRELSNLLERLGILGPSGEVGLTDLPKRYREEPLSSGDPSQSSAAKAAFHGLSLKNHLRQIETDLIHKAMLKSDGVVAKAARVLNLRRTTLVEKLGRYGRQGCME